MTLTASPKLGAYSALGATGFLVALVCGYPEAAVLGLPFIVAVLAGLALVERPDLRASAEIDRDRLLEGDDVHLAVTVRSTTDVPWLQMAWPVSRSLAARGGGYVLGVRLQMETPAVVESVFATTRWGVVPLPNPIVRAHDGLGFFRFEGSIDLEHTLRVYPRPETLRRALSSAETQVFSGNELSRARGDGIEFADVRPYAAGDRPRRVNWRLSTRTGQLHVNEMHPERNTDVVIFLDLFSDVRSGGQGTLDHAVRAAAALAEHYLARRDRVGVIGFGGALRWLQPDMGSTQIYRIVDTLIDSEVVLTYVWRGIEFVPPRTLPPKSLVIALTPLIDGRTVDALLDLRGRGFDLAVVEVMPEPFAVPRPSDAARLAHRIWQLERAATRLRYRRLGVPIVQWRPGEPLAGPIAEQRESRRRNRWLHV
ncbi:MAG: DUF58 domain-containing protein [Candidatus Limnocylindrales bacterium]